MPEDALKSLKTLFLSTLAVLLLWFMTWPGAVEKLQHYRQARDLHAWVLLKDLFQASTELEVFDFDADEPISTYDVDRVSPTPQGGDYVETIGLKVDAAWPTEATHRITLRPESYYRQTEREIVNRARVYRVESASAELPFPDYLAVFVDGEAFVVAADDDAFRADSARGLRLLLVAARSRFRPRSWAAVAPRLAALGFARVPTELSATNPILSRLYEESDPRRRSGGVQVFGLQLSLSVFYSAIGLLLAAVAFAAIGPVSILRGATARSTDAWILSLPRRRGPGGRVLEACIATVTVAWALAPMAILALQLRSDIALDAWSGWLLRVGAAGLVFATIVFTLAAAELRRVRLREAPAPVAV
jgi:hypothetical protein